MTQESKFLGLRTVVFHVTDLAAAKTWYENALQIAPYFDEPFYVGFNVGGFELGLHPPEEDATRSEATGNSVTYWGVNDVAAELDRLIEIGATQNSPVQEVGGGIKVADVLDPFGNVLGIIENPHFPNTA